MSGSSGNPIFKECLSCSQICLMFDTLLPSLRALGQHRAHNLIAFNKESQYSSFSSSELWYPDNTLAAVRELRWGSATSVMRLLMTPWQLMAQAIEMSPKRTISFITLRALLLSLRSMDLRLITHSSRTQLQSGIYPFSSILFMSITFSAVFYLMRYCLSRDRQCCSNSVLDLPNVRRFSRNAVLDCLMLATLQKAQLRQGLKPLAWSLLKQA